MQRYFGLCLSLIILAALPLTAQQSEMMRVNAARVNMRSAPSVDSTIVRGLAKGTVVTVLAHDGNWVKVQMQGQTTSGWVRSDLMIAMPTAAASSDATMATSPPSTGGADKAQMTMSSTATATMPPPPPPKSTKPAKAEKMKTAPSAHVVHSGDSHYRGGFTVFGGITSYKGYESATGTGTVSTDNASGMAAGLGFIAHLGGPIGIELDGAYVQKGGSATVDAITYKTQFNTGQASLLLRPAFGSGKVRFFLLGGGELGYLVNCKRTPASTPPSNCRIVDYKRTDYGAVGGAGISFGPLSVQVRYDYGIANLSTDDTQTFKNRGIMVLGGLVF